MAIEKPLCIIAGVVQEVPSGDFVDPATLGAGAADVNKFLRGDKVWATPPSGNAIAMAIALGG